MLVIKEYGNMLPEPEDFDKYFHEMYRIHPETQRKRQEWKKLKKKAPKKRSKQKKKLETHGDNDYLAPPEMELPGNASSFAVFASIRLAVLDRWMRQANQDYLQSSCSYPIIEGEAESDTEENSQSSMYVPMKVSKVVGIGLRSVFELIRESRNTHPLLCTKALKALLDVLQGQVPEGLKSEPPDIIDPLFDLLLDLATLHGPESSVPNDGTHLTAIACACLLSLVVVRGDTGKYLSAAAALIMCPRALAMQNIQMPAVLTSLQRSVHSVLMGKVLKPDWIMHGVPENSKIDSFTVRMPSDIQNSPLNFKSLASDGQYLYLFTSAGLFKIGTGYGGTLKGHVYVWKPDFYPNDKGTLAFCVGNLYLKLYGRRGCEFLIVERQSLLISGSVPLHSRDAAASVIFSDGENLGTILPAKDDGFVVRILNQNTIPAALISELPLKLARKCVDTLGAAPYDDDVASLSVNIATDDEVASICAGKDFGLIRTTTGKVLYCGKAASLGIKQAGVKTGKWCELLLTKAPKVTHIAVGHDGMHAIFLTDDGSVFFAGTARRGEDGDQNKVRRQPKAVKPKKMIKVDGQFITYAACNNGTTALINKDGELLMFGKDTTHTDQANGLVCSLKGEFIVQVALGKAHAVALTSKGQVFTFGINNKYQCGRDFVPPGKEEIISTVIAMDTCGAQEEQDVYDELEDANREDIENQPGSSEGNEADDIIKRHMCPPRMHTWHHDMCMVCTVCRECTGYSISCLSSMRPDRNPGQECGCGEGDSGCAVCGCCRICARENFDNAELSIIEPSGAVNLAGMMRLDLIFRDKMKDLVTPKQRAKLQEQLQTRFEERKTRRKGIVGTSKQVVKGKSPRSSLVSSPIHRSNNVLKQANILAAKEQTGSDVERDTTKIACLPPAKIQLVCDSPVIQIACGLHHTVLLLQNGQVYSFGSNQYGQLGCGDILAKANIQLVKLPCSAVHIAAGSNHTVVLTSKGEVYTFGNYQKGQLGRVPPITSPQDVAQPGQSNSTRYQNPRCPWYSIPGPITNIGPRHGRRATWVGASGDQTFIKIDESLINTVSLAKSTVTANRSHLLLIPNLLENANTFKSLVINKRDGTCSFFKGKEQVDFYNKCVYLDPIYNTLWSYNPTNFEISLHNIVACDLVHKSNIETTDGKYLVDIKIVNKKHKDEINLNGFNLSSILTPELALPVMSNCQVTRLQAAINLLCCLDTLSVAHDLHLSAIKEEVEDRQMVSGKRYCRDDFQCVNRFESHGGGWGYSGHSVEAVRFMADIDILLGGFGLFGGRGEYTAKVKLWDIGPEGGEQEGDGELLAETEEVPYECGPRQKFAILFDEPIALQAQRWYVAWAQINGPSSDCGSAGQAMVTTEDQVLFYFKSSKKSNNGTDVNAGQIPQLLYKVITMEHQAPVRPIDQSEPVQVLSKEFSRSVSKECFQSLLSLLQWSWNTFKVGISDGQSLQHMYTALELERLVYVSRASLRLLRTFTNEIYPNHITRKNPLENVHLAGSVGDVRSLLKQMLSDNLPLLMQSKKSTRPKPKCELYVKMLNGILDECHNTFVACFHAFYPTTYLKWTCLCDLLTDIDSESKSHSSSNSQRLLSAVLCALCGPTVRLRSTFPLLGGNISSDSSLHKGLSPSDNTGLPMMSGSDTHHYPILVEQMSYRSQMESVCSGSTWSWKEVLDRLLKLITEPVSKQLLGHKITPLPGLTKNCCHLLARVIAELVHQCSGNDEDLHAGCGRILHMTPPRFTRVNNSRTWNTGNGSPDAIAFQVDRPGISIAGAGVYGGLGHFEYELELLEDQSTAGGSDQSHTQRWNSLEATRGSFGPEDYPPEIVEIKFDKPVSIKENTKYALRLRNHGGRTNNGDTGVNALKGSDNTTFTFTTCSLSFNGTTVARGQIPVILYYSNPAECARISSNKLEQYARKGALSMTTSIIQNSSHLLILAREKADEIPCGDILNNACIIKTLLPLVMAHISSLATSDPRCAVQILNLIQEILPHVAALNLLMGGSGTNCNISQTECFDGSTNTTSLHYTWVQSEHPYKPATVSNYRVLFPDSVKWISIEFDTTCATVQPEDSLQLYVPCLGDASGKSAKVADSDEELPPMPYWPVLHRFSSCMQWPQASIVLPGHEVVFSLETASDYLKDDRASSYGFRCMVVGYEWPPAGGAYSSLGLKHLEAELAFLGGMCAASMIKKDLQLPPVGGEEVEDEDVEVAEFVAAQTLAAHGQLLSKGLALSSPPTVTQALDGTLPYRSETAEHTLCECEALGQRRFQHLGEATVTPDQIKALSPKLILGFVRNIVSEGYGKNGVFTIDQQVAVSVHSNERLFLRDFVGCIAGSSGGRLAQWLQPGSRVDPSKCHVLYSRDDLRCGWPAIITVLTCDQYSDVVNAPNMKVEVKAIPIDKKELGDSDAGRKMRRVSQADPLTFGGLPPPPLHHPYEHTIKDKMCFHSITAMKAYQNYSFEELRYTSPPVKRSSENMLVRPNGDGSYSATWTPASIGCYSIVVNIDGYELEEMFKVEVKEPPQGLTPPSQNVTKKYPSLPPVKRRKFVAKNSAGLRIRALPSLQSDQIGIVPVNGTVAFTDEIHNDDGVWLRLTSETITQYCQPGCVEAWSLQYNQHLGKTLLLPVEEPKSILDQVITETIMRKLPEIHDRKVYQVIKCGASGHNVRSRPSLKAPPVGMLVLGNRISVSEYVVNSDGCWVLLDNHTREKFCFNVDGEAWSLAIGQNNTLYLGIVNESDKDLCPQLPGETDLFRTILNKRGFDFNSAPSPPEPPFTFSPQPVITPPVIKSTEVVSGNPFVFGDNARPESPKMPRRDKKDCKLTSLPKWFKTEDPKSDLSEFSGVSVKDLVKAIGESRANGNGVTPPDTPKRSCSPRTGHFSPKPMSRSSSPVAIPPGRTVILHDSGSSSPQPFGSPRSIGISPLVSGAGQESSARRGSNQSDTSALVSSITRDISQSPSQATQPRDLSPSPSGSSLHTRSETSPPRTPIKKDAAEPDVSQRVLTQTGTQTSPETSNIAPPVKGHFSIGTGNKEERVSPKMTRKDRSSSKSRSKRAISPANAPHFSTTSKVNYPGNEPIKQAVSPSVAEAMRAVFAAFLWHEGIVHDAMACASFLKFHPTLPKQGALVVTRHGPSDTPVDKRRQELSKEERARQRHSVEVANAGNYLHIQPSTLESLTRSAANASANRNRGNRKTPDNIIKEDQLSDANYGYHTISVLPPALKCLVYLWEELTGNCIQALAQQLIASSPVYPKTKKLDKAVPKNEAKDKTVTVDKETKKSRKKKVVPRNYLGETICELCGVTYPHPVTYHMRQAHPGCGHHAGSKGYSPSGNYCRGWAGNCGNGGVHGSTWYLLCESCREKYVKTNRGGKAYVPKAVDKTISRRKTTILLNSPMSIEAHGISEAHIIMKNNATFLLDLASASETNLSRQRRPSSSIMPSVSENNSPPDYVGPFSPAPPFQCLQSLGADPNINEAQFYEEVLRRQRGTDGNFLGPSSTGQRPLSEVSLSDDTDSTKGLRFHRSVSMGTNGVPWSKTGLDGRIIMMRKRNNSSSEMANESGSSLLCNPSPTLLKLVPKMDSSAIVSNNQSDNSLCSEGQADDYSLMQRPTMRFLLQQHDLESLQLAMKQALRKAMCRVYAMQSLNWLLRSVTQPVCLHDLLWWFVTSLTPIDVELESEEDNKPPRKIEDQEINICEHPLSDITIAGDAVHPLPSTFHTFLQTIADLMVLLPMGSALQQMAVRCWGIKFLPADHSFLHRSQVFSNISKILSRSEEIEDTTISMHESALNQATCLVESLKDLTQYIEIKASSRLAMIGSLTDGSTETFWESGDEDRNKTKILTIICAHGHHPKLICVHIDNCRDLANKISTITFFSGPNSEELVKLRTVEVETRLLGGWVNCPIQGTQDSIIRLEMKGPDNSVRVRQIRVLGEIDGESLKVGKQYNATTIQQRNCESETLRVFRLITSQVFGKLVLVDPDSQNVNMNNLDSGSVSASESLEPLEESNDLREHMVGILFSRSKLTHLQKQVIVHIVQAIRKEALRVKEDWEMTLCMGTAGSASSGQSQDATKNTDTYCFEMLSMVLALSGSSVGRAYLSHQGGLLSDLLSLLHTGSARVQRQVTALLKRMLPEISPESFAKAMNIQSLPPKDFSIVAATSKGVIFDTHRAGILDVLLSVIAKSLTVQIKAKGKTNSGSNLKELNTVTLATSIHPKDNMCSRWWLRGYVSRKLAEVIVHLIKDMASGKLSEAWGNVTKAAIAQNILNLTQLSEDHRIPSICLRTPTLWLALASLCVLDKDHVERLSSGQWTKHDGQPTPPRPTCTNHDDGETNAVIQCSMCGNLCADCDRFLHLHRKTRNHQRQVCKEEEEAIKVELHEGCGRTKLFWLLAVADARTLKALVEYREGSARHRGVGTSGQCRFCGAVGSSGLLAIGNVCADQECQEYARTACTKLLTCGHMCGGVQGEFDCLPCLHGCSSDATLRQDADDMCMICFTEALSCAPAVQLRCGHVFHLHCCKTVLMKRWAGPRITFSFSLCPICKSNMEHGVLRELLAPIQELFNDVQRKALLRLEYEGLLATDAVATPGGRFYNNAAAYAMDRYAYYVCYKCNKAYYGGEARCDAEVSENYDPTELVCGGCSDVARAQMCPKHGTDFLEYKCRYCCSVAVFFCFGTTHFCNPCHDDFQRVTNLPKNELPQCPAGPKAKQLDGEECPLHVKHPPTGEEFALGCGVCRNAHTF